MTLVLKLKVLFVYFFVKRLFIIIEYLQLFLIEIKQLVSYYNYEIFKSTDHFKLSKQAKINPKGSFREEVRVFLEKE